MAYFQLYDPLEFWIQPLTETLHEYLIKQGWPFIVLNSKPFDYFKVYLT